MVAVTVLVAGLIFDTLHFSRRDLTGSPELVPGFNGLAAVAHSDQQGDESDQDDQRQENEDAYETNEDGPTDVSFARCTTHSEITDSSLSSGVVCRVMRYGVATTRAILPFARPDSLTAWASFTS